jgi:hypothetical protein
VEKEVIQTFWLRFTMHSRVDLHRLVAVKVYVRFRVKIGYQSLGFLVWTATQIL